VKKAAPISRARSSESARLWPPRSDDAARVSITAYEAQWEIDPKVCFDFYVGSRKKLDRHMMGPMRPIRLIGRGSTELDLRSHGIDDDDRLDFSRIS
jgi:hypothetical protein